MWEVYAGASRILRSARCVFRASASCCVFSVALPSCAALALVAENTAPLLACAATLGFAAPAPATDHTAPMPLFEPALVVAYTASSLALVVEYTAPVCAVPSQTLQLPDCRQPLSTLRTPLPLT